MDYCTRTCAREHRHGAALYIQNAWRSNKSAAATEAPSAPSPPPSPPADNAESAPDTERTLSGPDAEREAAPRELEGAELQLERDLSGFTDEDVERALLLVASAIMPRPAFEALVGEAGVTVDWAALEPILNPEPNTQSARPTRPDWAFERDDIPVALRVVAIQQYTNALERLSERMESDVALYRQALNIEENEAPTEQPTPSPPPSAPTSTPGSPRPTMGMSCSHECTVACTVCGGMAGRLGAIVDLLNDWQREHLSDLLATYRLAEDVLSALAGAEEYVAASRSILESYGFQGQPLQFLSVLTPLGVMVAQLRVDEPKATKASLSCAQSGLATIASLQATQFRERRYNALEAFLSRIRENGYAPCKHIDVLWNAVCTREADDHAGPFVNGPWNGFWCLGCGHSVDPPPRRAAQRVRLAVAEEGGTTITTMNVSVVPPEDESVDPQLPDAQEINRAINAQSTHIGDVTVPATGHRPQSEAAQPPPSPPLSPPASAQGMEFNHTDTDTSEDGIEVEVEVEVVSEGEIHDEQVMAPESAVADFPLSGTGQTEEEQRLQWGPSHTTAESPVDENVGSSASHAALPPPATSTITPRAQQAAVAMADMAGEIGMAPQRPRRVHPLPPSENTENRSANLSPAFMAASRPTHLTRHARRAALPLSQQGFAPEMCQVCAQILSPMQMYPCGHRRHHDPHLPCCHCEAAGKGDRDDARDRQRRKLAISGLPIANHTNTAEPNVHLHAAAPEAERRGSPAQASTQPNLGVESTEEDAATSKAEVWVTSKMQNALRKCIRNLASQCSGCSSGCIHTKLRREIRRLASCNPGPKGLGGAAVSFLSSGRGQSLRRTAKLEVTSHNEDGDLVMRRLSSQPPPSPPSSPPPTTPTREERDVFEELPSIEAPRSARLDAEWLLDDTTPPASPEAHESDDPFALEESTPSCLAMARPLSTPAESSNLMPNQERSASAPLESTMLLCFEDMQDDEVSELVGDLIRPRPVRALANSRPLSWTTMQPQKEYEQACSTDGRDVMPGTLMVAPAVTASTASPATPTEWHPAQLTRITLPRCFADGNGWLKAGETVGPGRHIVGMIAPAQLISMGHVAAHAASVGMRVADVLVIINGTYWVDLHIRSPADRANTWWTKVRTSSQPNAVWKMGGSGPVIASTKRILSDTHVCVANLLEAQAGASSWPEAKPCSAQSSPSTRLMWPYAPLVKTVTQPAAAPAAAPEPIANMFRCPAFAIDVVQDSSEGAHSVTSSDSDVGAQRELSTPVALAAAYARAVASPSHGVSPKRSRVTDLRDTLAAVQERNQAWLQKLHTLGPAACRLSEQAAEAFAAAALGYEHNGTNLTCPHHLRIRMHAAGELLHEHLQLDPWARDPARRPVDLDDFKNYQSIACDFTGRSANGGIGFGTQCAVCAQDTQGSTPQRRCAKCEYAVRSRIQCLKAEHEAEDAVGKAVAFVARTSPTHRGSIGRTVANQSAHTASLVQRVRETVEWCVRNAARALQGVFNMAHTLLMEGRRVIFSICDARTHWAWLVCGMAAYMATRSWLVAMLAAIITARPDPMRWHMVVVERKSAWATPTPQQSNNRHRPRHRRPEPTAALGVPVAASAAAPSNVAPAAPRIRPQQGPSQARNPPQLTLASAPAAAQPLHTTITSAALQSAATNAPAAANSPGPAEPSESSWSDPGDRSGSALDRDADDFAERLHTASGSRACMAQPTEVDVVGQLSDKGGKPLPDDNPPSLIRTLYAFMAQGSGASTERPLPQQPGWKGVTVWIDSMAPRGVTACWEAVVRVREHWPAIRLDLVSGSLQVEAVVDIGVHMLAADGSYKYVIIPDYLYVPTAKVELYPVRTAFHRLRHRHEFDDTCTITLPDGTSIPFQSSPRGYSMRAYYGAVAGDVACPAQPLEQRQPSPAPPPNDAHELRSAPTDADDSLPNASNHPMRHADTPQGALTHPPQMPHEGSSVNHSITSKKIDLLWRRLGYPAAETWRHVHSALTGTVLKAPPPPRDTRKVPAAMLGRMRAVPYPSHDGGRVQDSEDHDSLLEKLYMDFAGPTVKSVVNGHKFYCGVIDAWSGYARVLSCHGATARAAVETLESYVADVRALSRAPMLAPRVVRSDQGSAFMATEFTDYVQTQARARHSPACTYSPQQNTFIERFWGTLFGVARTLLAASNLPPSFHPFAIQCACWLRNRLPSSTRGNLSPYQRVSNRAADVTYLRAFGCACFVHRGKSERHLTSQFSAAGGKLTDRGFPAIYLGPSEISPGHVIYTADGKISTSRDVIFDESSFPGIQGLANLGEECDSRAPEAESSKAGPTPAHETQDPCPGPSGPTADRNESPVADVHRGPTLEDQYGDIERSARAAALGASSSTDRDDPTEDPSSIHFARNHPSRQRKPPPGFAPGVTGKSHNVPAMYTDPTASNQEQAANNFSLLAARTSNAYPDFVYESAVGYAAVVQKTLDLGDIVIPKSYKAAMASNHATYWREALTKELQGLLERSTWEVIQVEKIPSGAKLLNCHVVFAVKRNADGSIERFKCRLVAEGNTQRPGVDYDRIFATVVKHSTLRIILALACSKRYNLSSVDVKQAFLQAKLDRPQYMRMPPGLPRFDSKGKPLCCKLLRSIYGLSQASRCWAELFAKFMLDYGFERSTIDTCLFTLYRDNIVIWACVWVDDVVIADNSQEERNKFVKALHETFPLDDKGTLEWILGIEVKRDIAGRTLTLSQELYVKDIVGKHVAHLDGMTKRFDSPMAEDSNLTQEQCPTPETTEWHNMKDKHDTYMTVVGAMLYLAACTRPDISYCVSVLARFVSNPAPEHFQAMQRLLIYVRDTASMKLVYKPDDSGFTAYSDASWATRLSTSGGLFLLNNCLVAWYSRLQKSVSHSSAEAEFIGASAAAREGIFHRDVQSDLKSLPYGPTTMYLDSKSAIDLCFDAVAFKKTKHILRDAYFLRDLVQRLYYVPKHVSSENMLADILTKPLPRPLFVRLRGLLSLVETAENRVSRRG